MHATIWLVKKNPKLFTELSDFRFSMRVNEFALATVGGLNPQDFDSYAGPDAQKESADRALEVLGTALAKVELLYQRVYEESSDAEENV